MMPQIGSWIRVFITIVAVAFAGVGGWYLWKYYEERHGPGTDACAPMS